jgi:A/G-specific adenine glycosylase
VAKPPSIPASLPAASKLPALLLAWYDRHRRALPWRARPGETPDPYRVWLSEIMLQQTTVATVGPYFVRFLERWPDLHSLARASLDDVLHAWQGLGYYARARNLHACARDVAARLQGRFPEDEAALRALPGIGAYTAAAISAIAFNHPASALDGNGERVIARLYGVKTPLPAAKPELRRLAARLVPASRPGDYAQALMDLGAILCTPVKPKCALCPWRDSCRARIAGIAESLPARAAKKPKPRRHGVAFWAVRSDGAVLLRRRPEKGLLGGMIEVPSTSWRSRPWGEKEAARSAPCRARWRPLPGVVRHSFTHFDLDLTVMAGAVDRRAKPGGPKTGGPKTGGLWVLPGRIKDQALPSLMKKVIAHARNGGSE